MPSENNNSKKNNFGSNGSPQRFQPKVLLVYLVIVAAILTIWLPTLALEVMSKNSQLVS